MPGSQPGMPSAAMPGPSGLIYVNPATSPAYANLPAGSPGALMLEGPQAPAPAPAEVFQVVTLPPPPGVPGRLVKGSDGTMSVSPSGIVAPVLIPAPPPAVPPAATPLMDPPLIQTNSDGSLTVYPMVYPPIWGQGYLPSTGGPWDDSVQINDALSRLTPPGQVGPTVLRLVSGGVYTILNTVGGAAWNYGTWIDGQGATLNWQGAAAGPCVSLQGQPSGGSYPVSFRAGGIDRLNIINANGQGTIGLQYGSGSGFHISRLQVGAPLPGPPSLGFSQYGIYEVSNNGFTEKTHLEAHCYYNATQFAVDSPVVSGDSHEYCNYEVEIHCERGQTGFALLNNAWMSGGEFRLYGNMQEQGPTNPTQTAAIDLSGMAAANTSGLNEVFMRVQLETTNSGAYDWVTIKFGANGVMLNAYGVLRFNGGNWQTSDAVAAQFNKFGGPIFNETVLAGLNTTAPTGWP